MGQDYVYIFGNFPVRACCILHRILPNPKSQETFSHASILNEKYWQWSEIASCLCIHCTKVPQIGSDALASIGDQLGRLLVKQIFFLP